jgi:sigma-B regulation protein RsbU (phosphoserine phosphatase)
MRILIAEDDRVSRRLLESHLLKWGHEVVVVEDGGQALSALQRDDAPELAILDWMMPGMDGVEICRRIRAGGSSRPLHIILLTARISREDLVEGLEAGADDYVTKPFDPPELRARVRVGMRIIELQRDLQERVRELEEALEQVDHLQGLLPICAYCKKIRDDRNYWHQVESYVTARTAARFSHGICPDCLENVIKPQLEEGRRQRAAAKAGEES